MIEYKGKEKVLINDRIYNLHRFTENFGGARLNSWLDDNGLVIKEESPAGFVFIKEPEFKAKSMVSSDEDRADLLASVAVQVTSVRPTGNAAGASLATTTSGSARSKTCTTGAEKPPVPTSR